MKKAVALLLFIVTVAVTRAQVAGMSALSVLDMPVSTRAAGVGFDYLAVGGGDISMCLGNPSLISESLSGQVALGYVNLFGQAHFGSVVVGRHFNSIGNFAFGLQYASYGRFEGYDENDQYTGSFSAADYVLTIGWGRRVDENVYIGASLKPVLSHYESYTAFALAFDLAATYLSSDSSFCATMMGRNIGAQIATFDGHTESLPFKLSVVGSYRLQDAPFRLMFALNELQTWDLRYEDPLNPSSIRDPFTGEVTRRSDVENFFDNVGRHLSVGVELTLKGALFLRLGYSYRQMVEMKAADRFNTSGFSFGIGFKAKRFEVSYARNNYHISQAPNFISVVFDL
jgi:hypothetical protein